MLDERLLDLDAALRVGRVTGVEGRRVKVAVDKLKNGSHSLHGGAVLRNAGVGGYVKIAKGFTNLIAKVDAEFIHEDRWLSGEYGRSVDRLARTLGVSLVGYLERGAFRRGIRELPLLDNECFLLTDAEFRSVHQFAQPGDPTFRIGTLATESTQSLDLGVDAIFASHIGIFGNTGSGKSYTLAKIYHEILAQFGSSSEFQSRSRIVVIDFNGEYVDRTPSGNDDRSTAIIAGSELKQTYNLSTRDNVADRLPFSAETLNDPVIWQVLLDATEKTQAPFINRVLASDRWDQLLADGQALVEVVTRVVLRATRSSDLGVDRQTVVNLLWEIDGALGASSTTELRDVIGRFGTCLIFHGTQRTYYWEEAGSKIYATRVSGFLGRDGGSVTVGVGGAGGSGLSG